MTSPANPSKGSKRSRLRGMKILRTGTHRGLTYTERDLDDMVENFRRFCVGPSLLHRVPAVIGHSEDQEWLKRSDLPAAGWFTRLYRQGPFLLADADDIPPKIHRLLESKAYRTVSAEVYPKAPAGIPASGRMLRRVAFLGGDIPEIKGLDEIPTPEMYNEVRSYSGLGFHSASVLPTGSHIVYSEVIMGTRDDLLAALAQYGVDTSKLTDVVPDDVLSELCRAFESIANAQPAEEPPPDPDNPVEPPVVENDEQFPDPGNADKAMALYKHARKMAEKYGCKVDDVEKPVTPADDNGALKMSEKDIQAVVDQAVQKAVAAVTAQSESALGTLQKFNEENLASERKRTVDGIIERASAAGRLPPVEKETVRKRLMRADTKTVHKYTEGKTVVEGTEFDLQVKELESRPVLFGEVIRGGRSAGGNTTEEVEVEKVAQHWETYSETFTKIGTDKDELVKAFKTQRKTEKDLTAEKFLRV